VDWTIYGALIAGFLALVAAVAFLAVRALQAWRDFKRLRRRAVKELDVFSALAEETAERAARAGDQPRLVASVDRLRVSLARLAVLRGALDEVDDTFARVTAVYPRK
jgi:3-deoxy-D-manno-octulosonic-acid transferase